MKPRECKRESCMFLGSKGLCVNPFWTKDLPCELYQGKSDYSIKCEQCGFYYAKTNCIHEQECKNNSKFELRK